MNHTVTYLTNQNYILLEEIIQTDFTYNSPHSQSLNCSKYGDFTIQDPKLFSFK